MATGIFNSDTTFTASEAVANSGPTGSVTIYLGSAGTFFINSGTKVLKVTLMQTTKYIGVSEGAYYTAQCFGRRAGSNFVIILRNQNTGVPWASGSMPWEAYENGKYTGSVEATVSWSSEINTHTPDVEDY